MPSSPIVQGFLAIVLLTCGAALWKGGPAERMAAVLILVNVTLWMLADKSIPESFRSVVLLTDDALTALGLLAVTLRYGSPWLGVAMLLYAAQFALHAYYFVMERPNDYFHALVNNLNFMGVVLCLAIGTVSIVRRRAKAARARAAAASGA